MWKPLLAVPVFFCTLAAAQEARPPVETMTCAQMTAEIAAAGQLMNSQLDPAFATEAQAMHAESQAALQSGDQPNRDEAAAQVASNNARIAAQGERLQASMAGLDQERLMALMQRFEQQRCETPQ